jgi:heme a synthase
MESPAPLRQPNRPFQTRFSSLLVWWLLGVASLVFCLLIVGGITRLTESGLSITEWKPLSGALPPLGEAQWAEEFRKYRQIPEYREINGPAGMTLTDFKFIYFWEWVHRFIARLIGLVFALPLAWFWLKNAIPAGYHLRLLTLLALGGLQGAIGWWMVVSGLSQRTDVSHFRLSAHLMLALIIIAALVWTALDLQNLRRNPDAKPAKLQRMPALVMAALAVQLLLGAWVAGLNAGQVSNSWPLMNDRFWPEGIDWSGGAVFTFSHDPFLIHFLHRWWAWIAVIALIIMARRLRAPESRLISIAIHSAFGLQILLGIATVMTGVNLILAVAHQATGAVLVASAVWGAHRLGSQQLKGASA